MNNGNMIARTLLTRSALFEVALFDQSTSSIAKK